MEDFLTRSLEDIVGRASGPMNVRLVIQSTVAAILGVRAGLRDAREGKPPFFWALAFDREHRHELRRQGRKDIAKVFVAALVLDLVYQWIALPAIYPGQAVVVAVLLAVIPYLLLRAPVGRLFGRRRAKP